MNKSTPSSRLSRIITLAEIILITSLISLFLFALRASTRPSARFETVATIFNLGSLENHNSRNIILGWINTGLNKLSQPSENPRVVLEQHHIPILDIDIDPREQNKLNSDIPRTAKNYTPIYIRTNSDWQPAELKYRGDLFYHWAFPKKSLLIRRP